MKAPPQALTEEAKLVDDLRTVIKQLRTELEAYRFAEYVRRLRMVPNLSESLDVTMKTWAVGWANRTAELCQEDV